MTRVNVNNQTKEPAIEKALKFTIAVAAMGIFLCVVFMAKGL
ncbi:hypothetical protein LCGC14_0071150 [marine sediment metagenome]|uniref:Uncharacterized protein n=1 Tax=marine sediment metagenome TaxID=412755 RepID=A0A0F9Y2J2_9ZZZZ|nr:hypothetical protein [Maribacter sp.]